MALLLFYAGENAAFSWVLEGPQDTQSCLFDLNKGFPGRKSTTDLSLIPILIFHSLAGEQATNPSSTNGFLDP